MVTVNRANIRRVKYGDRSNTLIGKINRYLDNFPYLSRLSSIDRLLLLCGATLLSVVTFSYFLFLSSIFSNVSTDPKSNDPRLSDKLRKIGLSQDALLRRGGGKRIAVGPNHQQLDSEENAVALDIIATLNCDALQEELDRDWKTFLDRMLLKGESSVGVGAFQSQEEENFGFVGGGHVDDFAAELAQEVAAQDHKVENTKNDRWSGQNLGVGDGSERVDDHMNRRLLESIEAGIPDFDDPLRGQGHVDDFGRQNLAYEEAALQLNAQHLFCLAVNALTLPKYSPTSESSPKDVKNPTIHCDVESFEVRESLLFLWSSAKSQMPEDVLVKTLRLVTEHKETLRGNEVHVWYPEHDKGTEGMLRVLNSAYNGQAT